MNVRRAEAGSAIEVRRRLSDRDIAILGDVAKVRLLHARQIERLHFQAGSRLSSVRLARRTLQRLHDLGLLIRLDRRIGGALAGSSGYIYVLNTLGQRLLDISGPAGGQRRRRPWEPSPAFQDHILQISELYVSLRELERDHSNTELIDFQAETACWRRFSNLGGGTVTLKPDAFIQLADGDYEQVSFIEVDRGTEHVPALKRKLAVYIDAYRAGVEQASGDAFPNVVWIVPGAVRADTLATQIKRLLPEHRALFRVVIESNELSTIKGGE